MDFAKHLRCFTDLLEEAHIANFIKNDSCGALCDKYHLIITFQYFMRAGFTENDYTRRNFFLTLGLSHDIYDESRSLRHILMTHYKLASDEGATRQSFTWAKMLLLQKMQFKSLVDRRTCQKLFGIAQHRFFYKRRREYHTGVIRGKGYCKRCRLPIKEGDSRGSSPKRLKRDSDGARESFFPRADSLTVFL